MNDPLTFWQARVILLVTLAPQSVRDITDRVAGKGTVLDPARIRQLLYELKDMGLLEHAPQLGRAGSRYWLGSEPAVEKALDEAYLIVKGSSSRQSRRK